MGFTALIYWVPALFGAPTQSADAHPMAFIQRVTSMAREQYTPPMVILVPVLGALFTLASLLQIPAALASLAQHEWALLLLRGVAYAKVALYIATGLLLGLAIFSSAQAGDASWTFSAVNWVANLAMIGIYYWIIVAVSAELRSQRRRRDPLLDEFADDEGVTDEVAVERRR